MNSGLVRGRRVEVGEAGMRVLASTVAQAEEFL